MKSSCKLRIERDVDAESPNEWENTDAFLVGFHRDFHVVRDGLKKPDDVSDWKEEYELLPLTAYIHGGVALSLSNEGYPFNDRWDSCQVGVVLLKKDQFPKNKHREVAEALVSEWDQYLSGDIWGFIVEKVTTCGECSAEHVEELDSCWGFYGEEAAKEEGEAMLAYHLKEQHAEDHN